MKKFLSVVYLSFLLSAFLLPAAANAGVCYCGGQATGTPCSSAADPICTNTGTCPAAASPGGVCNLSENPGATSGGGTTATTPGSTTGGGLTNPLAGICKDKQGSACVQLVLGSVIKTALGVVGSIALLMAVWGGFLWLTSMGNESKVEQGKKTLIWSILGLVLIFGAYALTTFVFSAIAPTK